MEIKIQISDAVYAQLLNGTKRVQGSIAMVNAKEGNFNAYARNTDKEKDTVYKLPHGTLRINDRRTSVRLWFDRKHEKVNVAQAISAESRNATDNACDKSAYVLLICVFHNCFSLKINFIHSFGS